mgnify:CR=1 FL=1
MLIKAIMRYRSRAVIAIVMIGIVVSGSLLQPRFLNTVLGAMLEDKQDKVYSTGLLLLMIASAGLVAGIINTVLSSKISQEVSADIREVIFRTIQKFSYADVEELGVGNLVVRVTNDVNQIQHLVMAIFQVILRVSILLLGSFILAIVTIPQLWWLVLGMVTLIITAVVMIIMMVSPQFKHFQTLIEKMNTIVKEQLYGILVVKSFVQEKNQNRKFEKVSDELVKINLFVGNRFAFMEPVMTLIVFFAMYIAIYIVSDLAKIDPVVVGKIAAFLTYAMQMMFSIITLGSVGMQISRSVVSIGRIQELLNREPKITFGNESPESLEGRIDFEHVSFTYPNDDKETLSNISFSVDAGQVVGIVGTTGSGKSTLAQLLPRLFDPDSGQIKIGGKDIRGFDQETLRQMVSIVLQQAVLFSGTIADNLRQGFSAADQRMMEYAAGIAQANEFINQLSDNYESLVEERGSNFSGGQKQRLSLARGIIGQSKILILDDSTSALDAKSERLVQEALEHKLKGTTTLIIAQKISSVVHADKILVLDRGRLVGQGTHRELIGSNAVYGEIYASQIGKEG